MVVSIGHVSKARLGPAVNASANVDRLIIAGFLGNAVRDCWWMRGFHVAKLSGPSCGLPLVWLVKPRHLGALSRNL